MEIHNHSILGKISIMMEVDKGDRKFSMVSTNRRYQMKPTKFGHGWIPSYIEKSKSDYSSVYALWGHTDNLDERGVTYLGKSTSKKIGQKFLNLVESSNNMSFTKKKKS
jgi:hypothetical protein